MNILKLLMLMSIIFSLSACSEKTVDFEGTGSVTGRVVKAITFEPIENAKVVLTPTNNTVFTDTSGYFFFEQVAAGDYSVSAIKEEFLTSFAPATVSIGLDVNVVFEMDIETAGNRPPTTPVLISPEDYSSDLDLLVKLVWSSEDPENDTIRYKIKLINERSDEVEIIEELLDTTYVLQNLTDGTKYYWQISANDNINEEVWSTVNSFSTAGSNNNRFLYVKQKNGNSVIYSSDENGNERALTSENFNSWRPRKHLTTNKIAFLRLDNFETQLYVMDSDGSNVSKVSSIPVAGFNQSELDFSWSADGFKLIYPHYNKLYEINRDGSGLKQIYQTTDGNFISECDWSDDGKVIALKTNNSFGYNVSIYTISITGGKLATVLSGVKGAAGGLDLSIDGKSLLYTYDVSTYENASYRQLDTRMFIYDFSAKVAIDISSEKEDGTIDLDPRFSPSDSEVIFVSTSNDGVSVRKIFTQRAIKSSDDSNGNYNRKEKFENAFMPDWE